MNTFRAILYGLCGGAIGYLIGAIIATSFEMALEGPDDIVTGGDIFEVGVVPILFAVIGFYITYKATKE